MFKKNSTFEDFQKVIVILAKTVPSKQEIPKGWKGSLINSPNIDNNATENEDSKTQNSQNGKAKFEINLKNSEKWQEIFDFFLPEESITEMKIIEDGSESKVFDLDKNDLYSRLSQYIHAFFLKT